MSPMENVYKTTDQGFAAYLLERGFFCVKAIPAGDKRFPERKYLVFADVPDPKGLEDNYFRYRKETISARSYFEKMRTVRQILRDGLSEAELEALKRG